MAKAKSLFSASSDIAIEIENATSEKNIEEDWGVIINICDRAGQSQEEARTVLRCILKRLANADPHVGVKAVTLLDACVKNSGKTFHCEVASNYFETDFLKLMTKNLVVAKKLRESLKRWVESEFKSDTQLSLIPSLYTKLKNQGFDFSSTELPKRQTTMSKDPNVVESQEEEEQILKAIELSLKETSGSPKTSTNASLYPSVSMASTVSSGVSSAPAKEPRKVRALYDFEAAEDNELTFNSGEIICVIDDSDANWWKGSNQRGEGLFPANFVTADLSVEPEEFLYDKAKKSVQFKDDKSEVKAPEVVEINEGKIDRLLHLLHEADPTNPEHDTDEMLKLEGEVNAMGPLIDTELERVDRKHAQLTQLSADLVEALNLYHTLMREPQFAPVNKVNYGFNQPPTSMPPYSGFPPHMHHPVVGGPPPVSMGHPGDRPPPFMHQGPPPQMHHFPPAMPGGPPPTGQMPPPQGHIPSGPGLPQNMHPIPDDRRNEMRFQNIPNFGLPNMAPTPNFQQTSQGSLPGGPPQGIPYITSTTHIMQ